MSAVAISGMPAAQAGVAGAIASTSRQAGVALGVAVVDASLADLAPAHRATGPPPLR